MFLTRLSPIHHGQKGFNEMSNAAIHVVVASDDNYFRGLITTVYSLLQHSRESSNIVVHVIDGGITQEHKELLKRAIEPFCATIEFTEINQNIFENLASWQGSGKMAYARLLAPDLFPYLKHVIYCDIDIIWRIDIADLWEQRSDKFSLQYVRDYNRPYWHNHDEDRWLEEHGLTLNRDKYFCSGLLMLNLEKFREAKIHHSILNIFRATNGSAPYADQTTLNIFFSKRTDTRELDRKWQTMTTDKAELDNGINLVLHYAGDCPWKPLAQTNHILSDLHILWHHTYASIVGISTWQSLRTDNSPMMIAFSRILYLAICHLRLFKKLIKLYLRIKNKDDQFLDSIFRCRTEL